MALRARFLLVDLFFCLSRFVHARAYVGKFAGGLRPSALLRIRLRRLWPLIDLGTFAGALALLALAASCAVELWITVPLNGSVNAGAVDNLW
ncbi:hypothetical protein [Novosphingobium aquae]|uniref:Uncharacterized protein n=1 Tax=Novosphingobium aquae TaxID=3133435 RepID=A0ABU8S749_9SPHN